MVVLAYSARTEVDDITARMCTASFTRHYRKPGEAAIGPEVPLGCRKQEMCHSESSTGSRRVAHLFPPAHVDYLSFFG